MAKPISRKMLNIFGYKVDFYMKSNLLLLSGYSGEGKSVLYDYFNNTSINDTNIYCVDSLKIAVLEEQEEVPYEKILLNQLKKRKDNLIVIDNADSLLTDELRGYIGFDISNNYLIFGRNVTGLFVNKNRIAYLQRDDKKQTFKFDYRYSGIL